MRSRSINVSIIVSINFNFNNNTITEKKLCLVSIFTKVGKYETKSQNLKKLKHFNESHFQLMAFFSFRVHYLKK